MRSPERRRRIVCAAAAGLCLVAAGTVQAANWEITPRLRLSETWTDNATLAGDGDEQSDWVTSIAPGIAITADSARLKGTLDYGYEYLWYLDESDFNDGYHNLDASGTAELVEQHLFLDGIAAYSQANIDPLGRLAQDNIYQTGNRTDYFLLGMEPYWRDRFGDFAETEVRYQYRAVRYTGTDATNISVQDSDTNAVYATIGKPKAPRRWYWEGQFSYAQTEFDVSDPYEYGRASVDLGIPVGTRNWLTLTGGVESDVTESVSDGGFDSDFWYVGWRSQPTDLQTFSIKVGDRFYGQAYDVEWRRRGSRGELSLTYKEEPTTANNAIFDDGLIDPGTRPRLDASIYLRKRLQARMTYRLPRTRIQFRAWWDERDYNYFAAPADFDPENNDEYYGANLQLTWEASGRDSFDFDVFFEDQTRALTQVEQSELDRFFGLPGTSIITQSEGFISRIALSWNRSIQENITFGAQVAHGKRISDTFDDYTVNGIRASLTMEF